MFISKTGTQLNVRTQFLWQINQMVAFVWKVKCKAKSMNGIENELGKFREMEWMVIEIDPAV